MDRFKETINNHINLIKEYSSFLFLLVSFLGGAKQFITLCFYSPSLVQYFSLSQVLIDGVGITIKTIIFFASVFIGIITYQIFPKIIRRFFITIACIFIIFFLALTILPAYTPMAHLIFQTIFIISIGFLFGITDHLVEISKRKSIIITCIYGLFTIISDHQQPDDLININNHNIVVNKKFPNATLLYSNDTYLFYGVPKDPNKKIMNIGFLLPQKPENFVVCNFYVEKKDVLFEENK
ncbi:hypothetical protein [Chryseobacterium sp. c4a]|uniref:hypothetical protein n=1 Tax=Chryseobacterium sp. c4a TaxID=1573582 RepID=UPI00135A32CA|nr:hypothetical protein [Chryseobacterium sp. c4a]